MPDLSPSLIAELEARLVAYLKSRGSCAAPSFIGSGGSAATYRVETEAGPRAIKVYDPGLFVEANAMAERRRLELQRSLIGHDCSTLVTVYRVDEELDTAFIEMEFVPWSSLKKVLQKVPDERVSVLTQKLVEAVTFLEGLSIVHRDVKPENIHVSDDFSELKLIDLGVSRTLAVPEDDAGDTTDNGQRRPFISTAQYSSPEYLFRLDAPSEDLWKALNLYQVGAVLHDLINKRPLFQEEVDVGNRFVVAKAVLTKVPSFPDTSPERLASQKALAARCLTKDMSTRVQIVSWSDFKFEAATDSLGSLKAHLAKTKGLAGTQSLAAAQGRLRFERNQSAKRVCDAIRGELIDAAGNDVPITLSPIGDGEGSYSLELAIGQGCSVVARVSFEWFEDLHVRSAAVFVSATLRIGAEPAPAPQPIKLAVATINVSEDVVANDLANRVAELVAFVIDLLDGTPERATLHGMDVGTHCFIKADSNGH